MNEVESAVLEAWNRVIPRLRRDPEDLQRRLARRRSATLNRPPRDWCLAIRASDTRINTSGAILIPDHAVLLNDAEHPGRYVSHQVVLDADLLRKLCRPINMDGEWDVRDAARTLGRNRRSMSKVLRNGAFDVWRIRGSFNRLTPIIAFRGHHDPNHARNFHMPDRAWGKLALDHTGVVPDDLEQAVIRTPWYLQRRARHRNPHRWLFRGWRWRCPACGHKVRTLYYPLPIWTFVHALGQDLSREGKLIRPRPIYQLVPRPPDPMDPRPEHEQPRRLRTLAPPDENPDAPPRPVRYMSPNAADYWNEIVSYLTAGLLYGREVERPGTIQRARSPKRPYPNAPTGRPCPRRDEVFQRVLHGWTVKAIARHMRCTKANVSQHLAAILRREGVPDRAALAAKFGATAAQPGHAKRHAVTRRAKVRDLLLEGLSWSQIRAHVGTSYETMQSDALAIYAQEGVRRRRGLYAKYKVTPPSIHTARRTEIRARRAAGQTWRRIAEEMNLSRKIVENHARVIRREA
jgi:DNA-binding NarL/FixJ family response regulator